MTKRSFNTDKNLMVWHFINRSNLVLLSLVCSTSGNFLRTSKNNRSQEEVSVDHFYHRLLWSHFPMKQPIRFQCLSSMSTCPSSLHSVPLHTKWRTKKRRMHCNRAPGVEIQFPLSCQTDWFNNLLWMSMAVQWRWSWKSKRKLYTYSYSLYCRKCTYE